MTTVTAAKERKRNRMVPTNPRVTVWASRQPQTTRATKQTLTALNAHHIAYHTRPIEERPPQTGDSAPLVTVQEHESSAYWWWTGYQPEQISQLEKAVHQHHTL